MALPEELQKAGYFEAANWWMYHLKDLPKLSIFQDKKGGPEWVKGDIPKKLGQWSTQGWKLHICAFPADVENLFYAIRLSLENIAHKLFPFDEYQKVKTVDRAWKGSEDAAGKACVIYPEDPVHLRQLVLKLDKDIQGAINILRRHTRGGPAGKLRPFPGGVRGDLALGSTDFIYCRYGAFQGNLASKNLVYNNNDGKTYSDPRFVRPYPSFIKQIPSEISTCLRRKT